MNRNQLSRISIKGYKSMEDCDIKLKSLNILIGPNGAGKSMFIELLNMINSLFDGRLQEYVSDHGGPNELLRYGSSVTSRIEIGLFFDKRHYRAVLEPSDDGRLFFAEECVGSGGQEDLNISGGHFETRIREYENEIADVNCQVFSLTNIGRNSPIRQPRPIGPCEKLSFDGSNLAPYLYNLKESHYGDYLKIIKRLRIIAPFFGDFYLVPDKDRPDVISLKWLELGCDVPLSPNSLSDGMLRFACLLAIFRYPKEREPDIVLIDEPDLSLHPKALELLYHIMQLVSEYRQVVISTQSAELIDKFNADDIVIADRTGGKTSFHRIDEDELEEWLKNKTITELWANSIIGGQPTL
jgi:predicted ATPase